MESFSSQIIEQTLPQNEKKRFYELFDSFSAFLTNSVQEIAISKSEEVYSDLAKLIVELQNNHDSNKLPQKQHKEGNISDSPKVNFKKLLERSNELRKKTNHIHTASLDIDKKSRTLNKPVLPISKTVGKPNNSRLISAHKTNGIKTNEIETSNSKRSKSKEVEHSNFSKLPPISSPIKKPRQEPENNSETMHIKFTDNFFLENENTDLSQIKKKSKSVFTCKKDNFNRQPGPIKAKNHVVASTLFSDINSRKMQIISKLRKKEG